LSNKLGIIVDRAVQSQIEKGGGDLVNVMGHDSTPDNKMFVLWAECVDSFKEIGKDGMVVEFVAAPIRSLNKNENEVGMVQTGLKVGCGFELCGLLKEFVILGFGELGGFFIKLVYILRGNVYTENIVF
jgi:hypothetical protein